MEVNFTSVIFIFWLPLLALKLAAVSTRFLVLIPFTAFVSFGANKQCFSFVRLQHDSVFFVVGSTQLQDFS